MVATCFVAQNVSAYDFSEKNEDGVTIYYKIISEDAKTCEVTWMEEGKDFFLIKDNCLARAESEEIGEDGIGRAITCIGFRPLPDEMVREISEMYELCE